jgi:hypothetical protein
MPIQVIVAEFATGIIIHPDGRRSLEDSGYQKTFATEAEACVFAELHRADHPHHECIVVDETGREIRVFRPELTSSPPKSKGKPEEGEGSGDKEDTPNE